MATSAQKAHRKHLERFMVYYAIFFLVLMAWYALVCTKYGWTGFDRVLYITFTLFSGYVHYLTIHGWRVYLARHWPNDPFNLYHFWRVYWCYVTGKCPHKTLGPNLKNRRLSVQEKD